MTWIHQIIRKFFQNYVYRWNLNQTNIMWWLTGSNVKTFRGIYKVHREWRWKTISLPGVQGRGCPADIHPLLRLPLVLRIRAQDISLPVQARHTWGRFPFPLVHLLYTSRRTNQWVPLLFLLFLVLLYLIKLIFWSS